MNTQVNTSGLVWIIDDDTSIRWVLEKAFQKQGLQTESFENASNTLQLLKNSQPDVIVSDIRMPGLDGLNLLAKVSELYPELPMIIITAHSDLDSAVDSYEGGAFEYLPKPFDVDEVIDKVLRAIQQHRKAISSTAGIADIKLEKEVGIIGKSPAMQEVFRIIGRLARSHITVLINGETGTGKELVALALHRYSPRSNQPCIMINTSAIPRDLLESELFGHEKGAFTGALSSRKGRFEQADGGTLFLDEIGDMPADLQTRLLRVLADGEFYRVGGHSPVKVDVRVIAATHQDLEQRVCEGLFREDLFHRLNVIRIQIPPLRERREDIPLLLHYFLDKVATELSVDSKKLLPEIERYLTNLDWSGNVRQLENTCRWLTVMAVGDELHLDDLPPELHQMNKIPAESSDWSEQLRVWMNLQLASGKQNILAEVMPIFEKVVIETSLKQTGGRKQEAAVLLGWGRNTLTRKIKELGLE